MRRASVALFIIAILIHTATSFAGSCGDVNNNGAVNLQDVTYLVKYLYKGNPAPNCTGFAGNCADVNGSGTVNLQDATYLIKYLYKGGSKQFCGIVTDIDGNEYRAVKIGDQWWMAENLKVTHYRNGDTIPNVIDNSAWYSLITGAYCEYNNDTSYVAAYGRLYNWYAVNDGRKIAPAGWHVPSDAEWKQMEMHLGMSQAQADSTGYHGNDEGGKLKETGITHRRNPNIGATNESGFSTLAAGYRSSGGDFHMMGDFALFWTATPYSTYFAWGHSLYYLYATIYRGNGNNQYGFSVRCVKD